MATLCSVCQHGACTPYREVDGVQFLVCGWCGCLIATPGFIARVEAGDVVNYQNPYWDSEIRSAEERSYGSSLSRWQR